MDSDGRNRFVDGDAKVAVDLKNAYVHWSLCGSHLMLVAAGNITAGTTWGVGNNLLSVRPDQEIPRWIFDKVYHIVPDTENAPLEIREIKCIDLTTRLEVETIQVRLGKSLVDIYLDMAYTHTFEHDCAMRIQFDLMIL